MEQLSKLRSVVYHLYPGILILLGFIGLTPLVIRYGYPPQLSLLLAIILIAVPVLAVHLVMVKKKENTSGILQLNGYKNQLPAGKLILYVTALLVIAFVIWGLTQQLNKSITNKLPGWMPAWFTMQDFNGYSKSAILTTLVFNLVLNGLLAPFVEELYFRGYLLPRMAKWGKWAFVLNAVLFSVYHFWQPYIYLTLILSLLPMTYVVWKTRDLRVGILTHCFLNIIGALLTFGLLAK